ncbi:short-subunit dehydrogenase [Jatrophihabitans sp. GAS493]|uniref:SDR family NAD(P)-dependent oxidoreductase n=1 Tax=Jatrophihabitans sp. GAS493 TaxID=1907575 RepID=UPI000BB8C519|nr:SDR family NAD(P)-dependent oxidoreductase [Jatrophihabitans sp. GAS493]SOD70453.1 short-subunit dehydrogenase [Jatrophihabitans sp. GAS493]
MARDEALQGRRVLITGAARGIGAALAQRLHARGAQVALVGLETECLDRVAKACSDAPHRECDVTDAAQLRTAVSAMAAELGGLDVVVANAGVASALPLIGGDRETFERTIAVNLLGTYYTIDAAGEYIDHTAGYALLTASVAAAVQLPLMGAYSASKAAVEALGTTLRMELRPSGARVGIAYFGELDTEMTSRGFAAASATSLMAGNPFHHVTPLSVAIDALERGIARRSRSIVAPRRFRAVLPARAVAQRVVDLGMRRGVQRAVDIARVEHAPLTTLQPVPKSLPQAAPKPPTAVAAAERDDP